MKITGFILLAFLLLTCSTPKKEEVSSVDSTQVTQDTTRLTEEIADAPPQEGETPSTSDYDEPPFDGNSNNFPFLSMEPVSSDSLEMEINASLGELMNVYDTIQYSRITSSYSWERPYYARGQEGEGFMSTENEEETKTWLFDQNYRLKGFSTEFKTGPDYPFTRSIVYLFSNDSLKLVSELEVDASEVTVSTQIRMLALKCPRCGTSTNYGGGPEPVVSYLTPKELGSRQEEFAKSMAELIEILKSQRNGAKVVENDFVFSIKRKKEGNAEDRTKTITYPVKFVVAKELYYNYTPIK